MTILSFDCHTWPSIYPKKCFKWHFYSSRRTPVPNYLKSMHKCKSYHPDKLNYDHFILWPSSRTLTCYLPEQMFQIALLLVMENICAKLIWNPWINVEVMARTSSIYDHFIIWPSSVTLTFNLPKQMFQMALLLLKENNCVKLFWNPCIKVGVMALGQANLCDLEVWPWPFTYLNKSCHQTA